MAKTATSRSSEPFFGELYLRSTRPFLSRQGTLDERAFLARTFAWEAGPIVDLGCGHGRHLEGQPGGWLGVDLDGLSLQEAKAHAPVARGDFFALPFRTASLGGAFAWYNALFTFEEADQPRLFGEVARCLRPGALFVVQALPRAPLEREPEATFDGDLPDGSHLHETSRFDPSTGRDTSRRTLTTPEGRVMAASYFIRYYSPDELARLLEAAGFRVEFIQGGTDGRPLGDDATDVIVGARRG